MTPTKNDTNSLRVRRGGSWNNFAPSWLIAASRYTLVPARRYDDFGFRTSLPVRQSR